MVASRPGSASSGAGRVVLWREKKSILGRSCLRGSSPRRVSRRYGADRRDRSTMIAVAVHPDPELRGRLAAMLANADTAPKWTVQEAAGVEEAMAACRSAGAEVLLVGADLPEPGAVALLERVKRDGELFRTAVVLVTDDPTSDDVK